jgi:prevent-host-death family protein
MTKATTSHFKAHLSQFLKAAHAGEEVLVTDRDRPVARLVPLESAAKKPNELVIVRPLKGAPRLGALKIIGIALRGTDTTRDLREDRDRR